MKYNTKLNQYFNSQITAILYMIQFLNTVPIKQQFKFLINQINTILSTEHTIFYTMDKVTNVIEARYCLNNEIVKIQKHAIFGIAEYVIRTGKVLRVDQNHTFPYVQMEISSIGETRIKSFLMVPIIDEKVASMNVCLDREDYLLARRYSQEAQRYIQDLRKKLGMDQG